MGWYITIQQDMRDELGLKGNELIVYAFINGYSQEGQGCYYGSLANLQRVCGIASRQTAIDTLKSLVSKGYIIKNETIHNGIKYVTYTCPKIGQGVQEMDKGCPEIGHNKKDININIRESNKFTPPTIDQVRQYCLERGNGIDPEKFVAFYTSKGWMVGKTKMKDWKSAIITWEKARKKEARTRTSYQPQKRESVLEHNFKVMDQMFGTNLHEQTYGKKEACDEQ